MSGFPKAQTVISTLAEFEIIAALTSAVTPFTGFAYVQSSGRFLASQVASAGTQNNFAVFRFPLALTAGTWTFVTVFQSGTDAGIITIDISADALTWTTGLAAVDTYNAGGSIATRSESTGLTIPSGVNYIRLLMATKNGASTAYACRLNAILGLRTGA